MPSGGTSIADNYEAVRARIAAAAARAERNPSDVTVVAVAKTFRTDAIVAALEARITDIGENRAQELREKVAVLGDRARWHFVGHLQTNKARHVVGAATLIHSVDRYGLGEAIARRARALGMTQEVLIEVNVGGEGQKHGVEPPAAPALAEQVHSLDGIAVRGVMTIPPHPQAPEDSRAYYCELAEIGARVSERVPGATELSMGMTRDFEVAIEEGATIVRIGEAIFGPRR